MIFVCCRSVLYDNNNDFHCSYCCYCYYSNIYDRRALQRVHMAILCPKGTQSKKGRNQSCLKTVGERPVNTKGSKRKYSLFLQTVLRRINNNSVWLKHHSKSNNKQCKPNSINKSRATEIKCKHIHRVEGIEGMQLN